MKNFQDEPQPWGLGPKDYWDPLHKAWYQPYRHDIVGNTLSADLLDYLARDAQRIGIRTPFDVKLLEYYVLVTEGATETSPVPATDLARCAIDLNDYKRGVIRSERINDVFRLLDFRHEIHEKAIYHRIVQSAIAMLGRALMLAGTDKPRLGQLYAIGEPHHVATGDDQFLRDLATRTPDGHAARRYHSIGQKILERRLYRPLMMIPGDEVYNMLPASYQRHSQDNSEKCLRRIRLAGDSSTNTGTNGLGTLEVPSGNGAVNCIRTIWCFNLRVTIPAWVGRS